MTSIEWLLEAPQFWLGFVCCAFFVLVVLILSADAPGRTVEVYRIEGRAPLPPHDHFHRPRATMLPRARSNPFRTEPFVVTGKSSPREARAREVRAVEARIKEARKRAMWHPHPDDDLPAWRLAW